MVEESLRWVHDQDEVLSLGLRGMVTSNNIVRIHPSIEALQVALSYGSALVYGTRVSGLDASRRVMGEQRQLESKRKGDVTPQPRS